MTLSDHLDLFYNQFEIPANGGEDHKYFEVPLPFFKLILPNFRWRRKMLHIHDLEHIVNKQDTSWKGEIFIASWEISTGLWKNFPICIFPLWTMGWGFWYKPDSVLKGFFKGNKDVGIASLEIGKAELLSMKLDQLKLLVENKKQNSSKPKYYSKLVFSFILSQLVFLSPLFFFLLFISLIFARHL